MPRLSVIGYHYKATREVLSAAAKHWAGIEKKQTDWLEKQGSKK